MITSVVSAVTLASVATVAKGMSEPVLEDLESKGVPVYAILDVLASVAAAMFVYLGALTGVIIGLVNN